MPGAALELLKKSQTGGKVMLVAGFLAFLVVIGLLLSLVQTPPAIGR